MASSDEHEFVLLGDDDLQGFPDEESYRPVSPEDIAAIQEWLAPTDYAAPFSEYGKHRASHLAGTGSWIRDTEQYTAWHDGDRGALWIKAIAGAGKSVLAASTIERLVAEQVPVLYFFFRRIISANQTPMALVRDYLSQLLPHSPDLQSRLKKFVENKRQRESVSLEELWSILVSALTRLPRVYCIVDALDEMDAGNDAFISRLVALGRKKPSVIKVLMTSRPVPHVEHILRHPPVLQILVQSRLIDPDISVYVAHRTSLWNVSESIRARVHDTMSTRAAGHFLYARLMMDDLENLACDRAAYEQNLLDALDRLPVPMAGMYSQMLLDHSRRSGVPQELQLIILQWVTRAERPLRLLELASMIEFKQISLGLSKNTKSVVREGCGPLLEIFEDETVHPIHHSFTEYLYDASREHSGAGLPAFPVLSTARAHRAIALTSLQYLASGWHRAGPAVESPKVSADTWRALKLPNPFLDYAIHHADSHLRKSHATDNEVIEAMDNLLVKDPVLRRTWLRLSLSPGPIYWDPPDPANLPLMHVAAEKGHGFYLEYLVGHGHDLECLNPSGRTPLATAAKCGHATAITALLQMGAKAEEPDSGGWRPLHHAAQRNYHEAVAVLLRAGVDPLTPKTKEYPRSPRGNALPTLGDTPLFYACRGGHAESVMAFVPYLDADSLQQALHHTLRANQHDAAVALLDVPDIDVNAVSDNQTPFYLACSRGNVDLMQRLLRMGADPHALSSNYFGQKKKYRRTFHYGRVCSPLHAFAAAHAGMRAMHNQDGNWGAKKIIAGFETLFNAGLDINSVDPSGNTVLFLFLPRTIVSETIPEMEEVLSYLLDQGLSATMLSPDGGNVFHAHSYFSSAIIDRFVGSGVDLNHVRSSDGATPLVASLPDHYPFALSLVDRGVNVRIANKTGDTPLHIACHYRCLSWGGRNLPAALLAAGADVHQRNAKGETPWHGCHGDADLYAFAIQHGLDLESRNKEGETILFQEMTTLWGSEKGIYKDLIKLGADPLARNSEGETILHVLCNRANDSDWQKDCPNIIRYFVEHGIDPLATDRHGNTLWHVAAKTICSGAHEAIPFLFPLLREYGVSPTAPNLLGQTPLHAALTIYSVFYPSSGCEYLLEHAKVDVNVYDYNSISPLHMAASFNLTVTCRLLDLGADASAKTIEGQTALMVACRTQQSDIVCRLLDHFKATALSHLVDQADDEGRTALHYACRAGVPEVVAMLLEAGADPSRKDKRNHDPLHSCAEYLEEDAIWRQHSSPRCLTDQGACYVLLTDRDRKHSPKPPGAGAPLRVRETIRRLIARDKLSPFLAHDADPGSPVPPRPFPYWKHVKYALSKGCLPMVDELGIFFDKFLKQRQSELEASVEDTEELRQRIGDEVNQPRADWGQMMGKFENQVQLLKMRHMPEVLANAIPSTKETLPIIVALLNEDNEPAVEQAARLGAPLLKPDRRGNTALGNMARWGFTDLLRSSGREAPRMNVQWVKEDVASDPDLAYVDSKLNTIMGTALERPTPNLDMVKLLVSEFRIDPNEVSHASNSCTPARCPVHFLAEPHRWWQLHALEFLLQNGAEVDRRNENGETPLLVALQAQANNRSWGLITPTIEILLRYGADPNAVDNNGQTCLSIAASHPECVSFLLGHGANANEENSPFLSCLILEQAQELIRKVMATGPNLNVLHSLANTRTIGWQTLGFKASHLGLDVKRSTYPLHLAASRCFDAAERKAQATAIIHLLLAAGANPFQAYPDGKSIIHCLAEEGGLIEPFMALPGFDIEATDPEGRTYLLAACVSTVHPSARRREINTRTLTVLLDNGASLAARDAYDRNALHCVLLEKKEFDVAAHRDILSPFLLPSLVGQRDSEGRTPFHYALSTLSFDLIDLLAEKGADLTEPDPRDGQTALHHLAPYITRGEAYLAHDPVKALPPEDLQQLYEKACVPLPLDDKHDVAQVRELVRAHLLDASQLARLERTSALEHFHRILKLGTPINAKDKAGETLLFRLMECWQLPFRMGGGILPALEILQDAGADFHVRNDKGESVLHCLATQTCHISYQKGVFRYCEEWFMKEVDLVGAFGWLVDRGVDIVWEDERHRTCLDVAAATGAKWMLDLCKRK